MLDRPVGDAFAVVEHARRDESAGRAHAQAGVAATAILGEGLVEVELGGGDDFAEQDVGAGPGNEQVGVLSEPADAGARGDGAIEHPTVVDVGLGAIAPITQHVDQRLHPFEQDLVIIASKGIGGDSSLRTSAPTLPSPRGGGKF